MAAYNKALLATAGVTKPASQWSDDSYSMVDYDGVIVMALAANAAKSTSPSVWNKFIPAVTTASPEAVVVHSYADGIAALKAGKKIDYVGATGIIVWNQYHNSTGGFEVAAYQPNGNLNLVDLDLGRRPRTSHQVSGRARAPAAWGPGRQAAGGRGPDARKGARACSCTLSVSGSSPLR